MTISSSGYKKTFEVTLNYKEVKHIVEIGLKNFDFSSKDLELFSELYDHLQESGFKNTLQTEGSP